MNQHWDKLGVLYNCNGLHKKLHSHAANPLPIHLEGDVFKILFSARDERQRSSVGAVDIDIVSGSIVAEYDEPLFVHGDDESFYSHGVSIGNTYIVDGTTYLLFMGWKLPQDGHWFGQIGRLIINKDFSLELDSSEPFLGLDQHDPISLSYPWVLNDGEIYRMWYGSTIAWDAGNGEMLHVIKYAESSDGHFWEKKNHHLPYKVGKYQAFSRPTILQDEKGYHMWFSYRDGTGTTYRIGCSSSYDAKSWGESIELDILGLSSDGWDSQMLEYPCVVEHKGSRYMLFNGNHYGKTGFGIARQRGD